MKKLLNALPIAIALFLLYLGIQKITPSKASETCAVVKGSVHDGDTFRVQCQGQKLKIRSACIDAPETDQPMGLASRDHLRSLLNRTNNQVQVKPITTDRYNRTIAEVYTGNQLVQLQQIKDGMAWANSKFKKDCPSWNQIEKAEAEARESKKGIWAKGAIAPWEFRRRNR